METYVILRRNGWRDETEFAGGGERAAAEAERGPDYIAWIRSYLVLERTGEVGSVCIYQASSPEAIRAHAAHAGLPVDEIVKVVDTVLVRPDPVPATV